ncbi:hypothetical protein JXA80_08630 [bacterium]|nr:hypothetical protein [candidate division CSSED10-310 bacterium]
MMTRWIAGMMTLLLLTMHFAADRCAAGAGDDWKKMDALLTEREAFLYESAFSKDPEPFVENWLKFKDTFTREAAKFTETYGSDRNSLNQVFESASKPAGVSRESYQLVNEFLGADIDRLHETIVGWAESIGRDQFRSWGQLTDPDPRKIELKNKYAQRALLGYRMAARLNPDGDYGDALKACEDAAKETLAQYRKNLESLPWPGHNPAFKGPGKPDALAKAALQFLRDNPSWSKPEYDDEHIPYAASVTGSDWEIWKRAPVTQETTQYSLDITVAFTGAKDPDIVYVYTMVFYTEEEAGVKKGLPFKYASSKQYQKFQMLKKNVRQSASSGSSGSGSGFGLGRLIIALLWIAGGLIGARSILQPKFPALKPLLNTLTSLTMPVGLAMTVIGLLGFLWNLVRFVPHASFAMQATGVILGIIFLKKNPGPIPPSAGLDKIPLPPTLEAPMGLVTLILGAAHLLFGGLPLL